MLSGDGSSSNVWCVRFSCIGYSVLCRGRVSNEVLLGYCSTLKLFTLDQFCRTHDSFLRQLLSDYMLTSVEALNAYVPGMLCSQWIGLS